VIGELSASTDGAWVAARYAVNEDLEAVALWDTATGALLWAGPESARLLGGWLIAAGRAVRPSFELDALLHSSGARTNLRLCEADLRAVPVTPPPPADSVWAPAAACALRPM